MRTEGPPPRRCPECGQVFLANLVSCRECGVTLMDVTEEEDAARDAAAGSAPWPEMAAAVPIRRCPECGEEFMPHVVRCSDCGATLVDAVEREGPARAAAPPSEPLPEAAEYVALVSGLTPTMADEAARHLDDAGIAFTIVADVRRGLRVGVARERFLEAVALMEREGLVPKQPDSAEGVVALEGGPCPACGEQVQPGTAECPGCGLQLAAPAPTCPNCGAEVDPAFDACPDCGQEQG